MGGYVGEVIRRRLGGAWVRDGGQPALDLPGGARIYPVQQVQQRLGSGAGSLTAYASALGADPGPLTPVLPCRCCGALPAADTKFRAVQSVLLWIGYTRSPGPFCRDCGTAVFRQLQQKTFMLGWYGIFSPVAALVLLLNWAAMTHVTRLAAPTAQPGAIPGRPMDPGRPLTHRPQVLAGILAPILLLTAFVIYTRSSAP
ncbi:hypothetical protein GCM10017581_076980 [Dactylosporangium matsuzakiense]|uniref:Uncharacterized protein n=1 Tax=Dactylosporangium matsuzakiense TaxID=53360 RepID=A0A9W6NQ86_9ACTN|nr:hypothetical protein GCM10017581_076980 [Dactylosporangium matsuzakiense]